MSQTSQGDVRRSHIGLLILIVALATVIGVSQVRGTAVDGQAVVEPVLGPPAIGDCLQQAIDSGNGWGDPGGLYPGLPVRRCVGDRFGEVVELVPGGLRIFAGAANASIRHTGSATQANALYAQCSRASSAYVGIDLAEPTLFGSWLPPGTSGVGVIGPDASQRAAGQDWLACVYTAPDPDGGRWSVSFAGSVRNAFRTGSLPGAFATCRASTDVSFSTYAPTSCDRPHPVEQFGIETRTTTAAERLISCRRLVDRLSGMPDATAAGALQVRVLSTPAVADSATPVYCVVAATGSHLLDGALLGLGDGRIPWAS